MDTMAGRAIGEVDGVIAVDSMAAFMAGVAGSMAVSAEVDSMVVEAAGSMAGAVVVTVNIFSHPRFDWRTHTRVIYFALECVR